MRPVTGLRRLQSFSARCAEGTDRKGSVAEQAGRRKTIGRKKNVIF